MGERCGQRATIIHCLGVIPAILLQLPATAAEREHAVRFAFAPSVDVRHRAVFEDRYQIPIVDAWAMTETGGAACTTTAREPAGFGSRCIGRPIGPMDYRLADDQGQDVEPGKPGELLVRSQGSNPRAGFFSGYLDDTPATEEAWAGGWFHTGDVVYEGEGGCSISSIARKASCVAVARILPCLRSSRSSTPCRPWRPRP